MTIYCIGNEEDSYVAILLHEDGMQTVAKDANADYGLLLLRSFPATVDLKSSVSECWVSLLIQHPTGNSSGAASPHIALHNSSTKKDAFRIAQTAAAVWTVYYNSSGTTYTSIGTFPFPNSNTGTDAIRLAVFFKRGASGEVRVIFEGQEIARFTGTYNTVDTTWDFVTVRGTIDTTDTHVASLIVSSTLPHRYYFNTLLPSAAGNSSQWDGSYADIDDGGVIDRNNAVSTDTTSEKFLATYENMAALPSNRNIKAVVLSAAGDIDDASALASISLLARLSSTDYTLDSMGITPGDGLVSYQQVLAVDPATNAWTESNVNSIEFGVVSG